MKDPFIDQLTELAIKDPRLMLLVGDLGFGMIERFRDKCPQQFLNVGIAEQNMVGVATGLALDGFTVFAYSIGNFSTLRCLEQIRNDAAYHNANVKIVAMGGGFSYGQLGHSHHATEDLAIMSATPGVTVVSPSDDWEAKEATKALAYHAGTAYLRLDKSVSGWKTEEHEVFSLGKLRTLRNGNEAVILTTGGIASEALTAAEKLESKLGLAVRVVSVHTLTPFDWTGLESILADTPHVVTLEEHTLRGGLGDLISSFCLETGITPKSFKRFGVQSSFLSKVGTQTYLRQQHGLDSTSITKHLEEVITRQASIRPEEMKPESFLPRTH